MPFLERRRRRGKPWGDADAGLGPVGRAGVPPGGGLGAIPERIDTHAAIVLLTPDRAYKLKRPVRYSFLDFTTLKRREQTCAMSSSSTKNARSFTCASFPSPPTPPASPWTATAHRSNGCWKCAAAEAELDRVAAATGLPDPLVDRLAETVATSHAAASPRPGKGGHAAMCEVALGNRTDLDAAVPGVFTTDAVGELDALTQTLLAATGRSSTVAAPKVASATVTATSTSPTSCSSATARSCSTASSSTMISPASTSSMTWPSCSWT